MAQCARGAASASGETYKIGLTWEPIDDLMFRYTRGTSFRAPALFEQFLGAQSGFLGSGSDPCDDYGGLDPTSDLFLNCDAEIGDTTFNATNGVTVFSIGGEENDLSAETSENETIGFTWRPIRNIDGLGELSLAVDRFSIEVNDQVAQLGGGNILNICYNSPTRPSRPARSSRATTATGSRSITRTLTSQARLPKDTTTARAMCTRSVTAR